MRYQGKIVEWNADKAFGFVLPNAGGRKIFIHLNEFPQRRAPLVGSLITFEIGLDAARRSCAVRAEFVVAPGQRRAREQLQEARTARAGVSLWLAVLWAAVVVALTLFGHYPSKLLLAWVVINVLTFALYAMDKTAAENGNWRTPEARLHLFALAGGWPAAAYAQQKFRHKTTKESFRFAFWLTVVLNIAVMLWLASRYGVHAVALFR